MAKTPASTLITDLAKRLDLDPGSVGDASGPRVDILRQLNISQTTICQDHSLRFLVTYSANGISLTNGASSANIPAGVDDGKTIAIGRAGGDGEVEYVPPDLWSKVNVDTYRQPTQTGPSWYTIAMSAGVNTFLFKPSNTSGGTLNLSLMSQSVPAVLTDATNSTSALPEGWEESLLMDHAEIELRRLLGEAVPQFLIDRVYGPNGKLERLYASWRTTKEAGKTDREQRERKAVDETLRPEK